MPNRPEVKVKAFLELCNYVDEEDECQYSISQLQHIMETHLDGQTGYATIHLKRKLVDHCGANIIITEVPGKESIVCKIIYAKRYTERYEDIGKERGRIVETPAAIV